MKPLGRRVKGQLIKEGTSFGGLIILERNFLGSIGAKFFLPVRARNS